MPNLYKFEEGSSVGYGIDFVKYITTKNKLTPANAGKFAKAAGGQYFSKTLLGDTPFDESLKFAQGRHYSFVEFVMEITEAEAQFLKKLRILSEGLEDKF